MTPAKVIAMAALMATIPITADAQHPYQTFPYYRVPSTPPSWSYDPYTSGLGPCPQRYRSDPPCRYTMHPTYGQPSYWPR
jgi:hypothetical protein